MFAVRAGIVTSGIEDRGHRDSGDLGWPGGLHNAADTYGNTITFGPDASGAVNTASYSDSATVWVEYAEGLTIERRT